MNRRQSREQFELLISYSELEQYIQYHWEIFYYEKKEETFWDELWKVL